MMEWVLILTFYAGAMSSKDSSSMVAVPGFASESQCRAAGESAKKLETMMKSTAFVCVVKGKP